MPMGLVANLLDGGYEDRDGGVCVRGLALLGGGTGFRARESLAFIKANNRGKPLKN